MSENISFISFFINNYHKCLSIYIYSNDNTSFFCTISEKKQQREKKNYVVGVD